MFGENRRGTWRGFCCEGENNFVRIYVGICEFESWINTRFRDLTTATTSGMRTENFSSEKSSDFDQSKKAIKLINVCLLSSLHIHDIYRSGISSKRSVKHGWFRTFMAQFMYHWIEFVVNIEEKLTRCDIEMEREFYGKIGWQLKYWDLWGEIDCLFEYDSYIEHSENIFGLYLFCNEFLMKIISLCWNFIQLWNFKLFFQQP